MFRVRTEFTGVTGTPWISNHFFDGAGDTTPTEMRARVVSFWNALNSMISTQVSFSVLGEVLEISPQGDAIGATVVAEGAAGSGQAAGDPLPWATQAFINWNTGVFVNGRRIRGRTFIPGVAESFNTNGSGPTVAATTAMNNAVAQLIGTSSAGFGVWSRRNNVFVEATGGTPSPRWGVLRSRKD